MLEYGPWIHSGLATVIDIGVINQIIGHEVNSALDTLVGST